MTRALPYFVLALAYGTTTLSVAEEDQRQFVLLPEQIQHHMLMNMRDHLAALNEILTNMAAGRWNEAADIAEWSLGMSSLDSHGAKHLGEYMPDGMKSAGLAMHRAASRFSLRAQEAEEAEAYSALAEITSACVACHSGYRIR